jgi:hypothetical protein
MLPGATSRFSQILPVPCFGKAPSADRQFSFRKRLLISSLGEKRPCKILPDLEFLPEWHCFNILLVNRLRFARAISAWWTEPQPEPTTRSGGW